MSVIEIPSSEQVILPEKGAGRPMGLRVLHAVEYVSPTWYSVRLILDGKGREVGRSRRSAINMECAVELNRIDAIKLGALVYKKIAGIEAKAKRATRASEQREHEAAVRIDESLRYSQSAAKLRDAERQARERAEKLPRAKDVPPLPANMTHMQRMRYEAPRTWEDEMRTADALALQALAQESLAADAKRAAKEQAEAPLLVEDAAVYYAEAQKAWEALAPSLCRVVWG